MDWVSASLPKLRSSHVTVTAAVTSLPFTVKLTAPEAVGTSCANPASQASTLAESNAAPSLARINSTMLCACIATCERKWVLLTCFKERYCIPTTPSSPINKINKATKTSIMVKPDCCAGFKPLLFIQYLNAITAFYEQAVTGTREFNLPPGSTTISRPSASPEHTLITIS